MTLPTEWPSRMHIVLCCVFAVVVADTHHTLHTSTSTRDVDAKMRVLLTFYLPTNRQVDTDNLAKSVLDGMQPAKRGRGAVVYRDDSQVVSLTVEKHVDRERPRVDVEVWRV